MATFEHYDQGTPSWVELSTPDQGAAREFYSGLFGWDYDDNDMGEMGHYYIATLQGSELGGVGGQMPGMEGHPAYWGVYLAVDDVDATTAKVERTPAARSRPARSTSATAGRMSAIEDPTGCPRRALAGRRDDRHRSAPTSPAPPRGTSASRATSPPPRRSTPRCSAWAASRWTWAR